MDKIRVLLADDHTVLRQGIAQALELQEDMVVVAQASNGQEAVSLGDWAGELSTWGCQLG